MQKKLNSVKCFFEDSQYNYETSVSANLDKAGAEKGFLGMWVNVAPYPSEKMRQIIKIEFTDNNLKSNECKQVLQLMDNDFSYQDALAKVLNKNRNIDKKELEIELNNYI
jgi:hypothetical protein